MQEGGDAMLMSSENNPSSVPATAKQGGEIYARWAWTEPTVWTERMLTALEEGVKGGVWFSLIDKVFAERTLRAAACKVIANKGSAGVDHVSVDEFFDDLDSNVEGLSAALRGGSYEPSAIRRVYISKLGSIEKRPLGIPIGRAYCISSQSGWGSRHVGLGGCLHRGGPDTVIVRIVRPTVGVLSALIYGC